MYYSFLHYWILEHTFIKHKFNLLGSGKARNIKDKPWPKKHISYLEAANVNKYFKWKLLSAVIGLRMPYQENMHVEDKI
jgi:hypothetical protein